MKKFYLLLVAAFIAVTAFAQQPSRKAALPDASKLSVEAIKKTGNENVSKQPVSMLRAPRKADVDPTSIIKEAPASAEVKYYKRSGYYHDRSDSYAEKEQDAIIAIAFDGDDVYMQNPVANFTTGSWMKGTKSGNTITFPLGQLLSWNESGNYGLYTTMVDWDGSNAVLDQSTTEITYTIDGDQIIQNGTSASHTFTVAWSDDDTAYNWGSAGGEYSTILTLDENYEVPIAIEIPANVNVETWYLSSNSTQNVNVGVGIDGNDFYIRGLYSDEPNAAVKGTIGTDGTVTFENGQYLGLYGGSLNIYFLGYNMVDEVIPSTVVMKYDSEAGILYAPEGMAVVINAALDRVYYLEYYYTFIISQTPTTTVEPPADLVTTPYAFSAYDTYYQKDVDDYEVQVGFDDNKVYFQGLSTTYLPEAWVVGTYDASTGTVSIPPTLLGAYSSYSGDVNLTMTPSTFVYDAANDQFSSEKGYSTLTEDGYACDEYANVVLNAIQDVAATPAKPSITEFMLYNTPKEGDTELASYTYPYMEFDIPTKDTEGNDLLQSNLSYVVLVEDAEGDVSPLTLTTDLYVELEEDMTEIPYGFSDNWDFYTSMLYLNQPADEIASWKRIGLQSIYRGGGEENVSEIDWFDIQAYIAELKSMLTPSVSTAISTIDADSQVRYYDLQGRIVDANSKGVFVKQITLSDGTVKNIKVVRK